jgi:hypothetical protein
MHNLIHVGLAYKQVRVTARPQHIWRVTSIEYYHNVASTHVIWPEPNNAVLGPKDSSVVAKKVGVGLVHTCCAIKHS